MNVDHGRSLSDITLDVKRHFAGTNWETKQQKFKDLLGTRMNAPDVKILYRSTRIVLGRNLSLLMGTDSARINELDSNLKVSKKIGISDNTVGRIRRGESSIGVDMLCRLANLFGVTEWELLCPAFDPANRPMLVTSAAEREMLALFRRSKQIGENL